MISELQKKINFIDDYFKKNPEITPLHIERVTLAGKYNVDEVNILYKFLKKETLNSPNKESSLIYHILGTNPSVDMIIGFLTAIQWTGTNVGSEIFEK